MLGMFKGNLPIGCRVKGYGPDVPLTMLGCPYGQVQECHLFVLERGGYFAGTTARYTVEWESGQVSLHDESELKRI